jgi:hypothetical protein
LEEVRTETPGITKKTIVCRPTRKAGEAERGNEVPHKVAPSTR